MDSHAYRQPLELLQSLGRQGRYGTLLHVEHLPRRVGVTHELPEWTSPLVVAALAGEGIERLWTHQARAAEAAWQGRHVVLSTGTASGKSLAYQLPALSMISDPPSPSQQPATVLYLAPTKALAADQLAGLERLALPPLRAACYDADTPADERRWIRQHANLVLTNPDLVHHSLLPGHRQWRRFLSCLRLVMVDECHAYAGVFGSQVALVLRRLRRVAAHYGASPTFVLASATGSEPARHASRLVGAPVLSITQDDSPRGAVDFALWEPPVVNGTRWAASTTAAALLSEFVSHDIQTLVFASSRVGAEAISRNARGRLRTADPPRDGQVAAYRGGYLPEERRVLEGQLRQRALMGVAATNALELGVDLRGLDAVLIAGWPGSRSSLWQQAGRAGRAGGDALAVLVAANDPLDSYLVQHPAYLFGGAPEAAVVDPTNPRLLAPQVAAAAAELPVTVGDEQWFGAALTPTLTQLTERGLLRRRPTGWYWARSERASEHIDLRGAGAAVTIVEEPSGRVIGTSEAVAAPARLHPGAVHLHQGVSYLVTSLDLDAGLAIVRQSDPGWSTRALRTATWELVRVEQTRRCAELAVHTGTIRVRQQVTGYVQVLPSGAVAGRFDLAMPAQTLDTQAMWWTVPQAWLMQLGVDIPQVPGALHAAEHAAIALLPLFVMADRRDIGGVSSACHVATGLPTVAIYDGHPGGAGFAWQGYRRVTQWLGAAGAAIASCPCEQGCPSCVQSPSCGSGNDPLNKAGGAAVLKAVAAALEGAARH